MLFLTLLRHAKSSWDEPDIDDHERPLAKRGSKDAPRIGRWLARFSKEAGVPPDHVLCSDAVRTRATLALVLPELTRGGSRWQPAPLPTIETDAALYLASPEAILERINKVPSTARHVVVIGHNPGLHMLALALTGRGERTLIGALARKFPTAAAAVFECDVAQFAALRPASARLVALMTPKQL
ncbi:MAG: histidine phosphatase family protein [Hyphomicrobiaceae bacterium]